MIPQTTALSPFKIPAASQLADAVIGRANVFEMTQAAEDAVLCPHQPGAWPHAMRAALAARIARLNDEASLSERYLSGAGNFALLADPAANGTQEGLAEVISFMDKVAVATKTVEAVDIAALQAIGVSDPDIVRLAELNAFVSYQVRVIAGLRLMTEQSR